MCFQTTDINVDPYLNADGIGHLTTEIWWSMLEMGISVVAACLPTIRPLFGELDPERIIHSIRSMFSLTSLSLTSSARRQGVRSTEVLNEDSAIYKQLSEEQGSIYHSRQKGSGESSVPNSIRLRDLEAQNNWKSMPSLSNGKPTTS